MTPALVISAWWYMLHEADPPWTYVTAKVLTDYLDRKGYVRERALGTILQVFAAGVWDHGERAALKWKGSEAMLHFTPALDGTTGTEQVEIAWEEWVNSPPEKRARDDFAARMKARREKRKGG